MADEPRWLSDSEQHAWRGLMLTYQLLFDSVDKQLRTAAGIPHAYYMILTVLSERPDHTMRMSELAAMTATSQSRTSHAVAALERTGWVERKACDTDKRGRFAVLTPAGYQVVVAAAPDHVAQVRTLIFDHLTTKQVAQLTAITGAINGKHPAAE